MRDKERILFCEDDKFVAYSMPGTLDHVLLYGDGAHNEQNESFLVCSFLKRKVKFNPAKNIQNASFSFYPKSRISNKETKESKYLKDVDQIIDDIQSDEYQKLVYSRIKIERGAHQDVFETFMNLKTQYPKAFVFCYHFPDRGTWMGATPELLVSDDDSSYKTMALAGTQLDLGVPLEQVVWQDKERSEQDFIVKFVEDQLRKQNITWVKSGTKTVRAGDVLHLCTDFSIDKEAIGLSALADLLHPGPAICGLPQAVTQQRITDIESHDREDYCGYLGPLDINGSSALFINLRSMKVYQDGYQLFLGGGITAGSVPSKEWKETEDKSQTLLKVIAKQYSA